MEVRAEDSERDKKQLKGLSNKKKRKRAPADVSITSLVAKSSYKEDVKRQAR